MLTLYCVLFRIKPNSAKINYRLKLFVSFSTDVTFMSQWTMKAYLWLSLKNKLKNKLEL